MEEMSLLEKMIWLMKGRDMTKEAKDILALLKEEIEKVENTHLYFGSPHTDYDIESNRYHSVFEQCRQAVLKILT